ncbi:MAG: hypothetical protein K9W44_15265 [Candidatus Lokiarchaeota archaeon]|nr:hypothetical protein [Candidatus Harpocratesius repetitus]
MKIKEKLVQSNKIILIGFIQNHHPIYIALINFLLEFNPSITLLTTKEIFMQIQHEIDSNKIDLHLESRKLNRMLKKNLKLINSHEIVIMEEYYGGFIKIFNLKFKNPKKIAIVHNVNKWFLVRGSIYYFIDLLFKSRYISQFDAYIVMSPVVKTYLKSFINNKNIFFFPGEENYSSEPNPYHKLEKLDQNIIHNGNYIEIVVPGMISEKRREYINLLLVLKQFYKNNPTSKIRINLLGSINNKENDQDRDKILEIINECNNLSPIEGERIKYGKKFIPMEEFTKTLEKADLILSNAKVFNLLEDRLEIYGITKITGISYIIYRYEKPAIIPNHQNILLGFDNQFIKFSNYTDIIDIFNQIEKKEINLEILKRNAFRNRKKFNQLIKTEKNKIKDYLNSTDM